MLPSKTTKKPDESLRINPQLYNTKRPYAPPGTHRLNDDDDDIIQKQATSFITWFQVQLQRMVLR